jgi:hypothetical protein
LARTPQSAILPRKRERSPDCAARSRDRTYLRESPANSGHSNSISPTYRRPSSLWYSSPQCNLADGSRRERWGGTCGREDFAVFLGRADASDGLRPRTVAHDRKPRAPRRLRLISKTSRRKRLGAPSTFLSVRRSPRCPSIGGSRSSTLGGWPGKQGNRRNAVIRSRYCQYSGILRQDCHNRGSAGGVITAGRIP